MPRIAYLLPVVLWCIAIYLVYNQPAKPNVDPKNAVERRLPDKPEGNFAASLTGVLLMVIGFFTSVVGKFLRLAQSSASDFLICIGTSMVGAGLIVLLI